jgi:hypothetical protein
VKGRAKSKSKTSLRRPRKAAQHSAVTFDIAREIAHSLPGVEASTSYGTPALKVRGKLFARLHQDGEALVLRSDVVDRQILMQADPYVFFITEHYRAYPWILVRLSSVQRAALPDLLERAWRLVAPKALIAGYDAQQLRAMPPNKSLERTRGK